MIKPIIITIILGVISITPHIIQAKENTQMEESRWIDVTSASFNKVKSHALTL